MTTAMHPEVERLLQSHTAEAYVYSGDPEDIEPGSRISPSAFLRPARKYDTPNLVLLREASWGDYSGSDLARSNYEVLTRDYPDTFVEAYGGHESHSLFLPTVGVDTDEGPDVTRHIVDLLLRLEDYPLLDEEHHSTMAMEDADEAWHQWLDHDVTGDLERRIDKVEDSRLRELYELRLAWLTDEDSGDMLRDWYYEVTGEQPEPYRHETATSIIFPRHDDTVATLWERLTAEEYEVISPRDEATGAVGYRHGLTAAVHQALWEWAEVGTKVYAGRWSDGAWVRGDRIFEKFKTAQV